MKGDSLDPVIDTEWADVLANEPVPLAIVSDCGRYEFYAERNPLPENPTDFVRQAVYPLLDRGTRALRDEQFIRTLHEFLARCSLPPGRIPWWGRL